MRVFCYFRHVRHDEHPTSSGQKKRNFPLNNPRPITGRFLFCRMWANQSKHQFKIADNPGLTYDPGYSMLIGRIDHMSSLCLWSQDENGVCCSALYALERRFRANLRTTLCFLVQFYTYFDRKRKLWAVNRALDNVITANAHKLSGFQVTLACLLSYFRSSEKMVQVEWHVNFRLFLLNKLEFDFTL